MLPILIGAGIGILIAGAFIGGTAVKVSDASKIAIEKKSNISNNNVTICMFGPRAVGKTSLLASMYENFECKCQDLNLKLTFDAETKLVIDKCLYDLKDIFNNNNSFQTGTLTTCDTYGINYVFKLGKLNEEPTLQLNFEDFPGGYLRTDQDFVLDVIIKSQVILIAIDTPALMEENGMYNDLINKPDLVKNFFSKTQHEIKEPRLVIFAPIKCEKYIPQRSKEVVDKVKQSYRRLLDIFSSEKLNDKIAAVITPVQTLGNIVFDKYFIINKIPMPYFKKVFNAGYYCPRDTEQPLLYLLKFLLKLHLDYRSVSWNLFSFLRDCLGEDEHLKDAIEKLSSDCKNKDGFEILMGQRWL